MEKLSVNEPRMVHKDIHYIDGCMTRYFRHKFEPEGVINYGFYWVKSMSNTLKVRLNRIAIATKALPNMEDLIGPDLR